MGSQSPRASDTYIPAESPFQFTKGEAVGYLELKRYIASKSIDANLQYIFCTLLPYLYVV